MNRSEFDYLKKLIEDLDNLYKVLEEVDGLGNLKSLEITGDVGKTKISFDKEAASEIHEIFRNKVRTMIKNYEITLELTKLDIPSIVRTIQINHFNAIQEKKWDCTYWFFDVHGTILKPTYQDNKISTEYYPYAKEVLQTLSKIPTIKMIMYTCSHPTEQEEYKKFFEKDGIKFHYINENPEIKNNGYGFYENKPYMNVLFEDKAGFDPTKDWQAVKEFLKYKELWPIKENGEKEKFKPIIKKKKEINFDDIDDWQ